MGRGKGSSSSSQKPDFTGKWKLHKINGDIESFMSDMGFNEDKKALARSANYGAGSITRKIVHKGNIIEVLQPGVGSSKEIIDGREGQVTVIPRWSSDEDAIIGEARKKDGTE